MRVQHVTIVHKRTEPNYNPLDSQIYSFSLKTNYQQPFHQTMVTETTKPHVLIVGAGLGGLTLAQCLRKQGVSFEIFERDASAVARPAGWAIALHSILNELISSVPADMPPLKEKVDHLQPLNLNAQIGLYYKGVRYVAENTAEIPVIRANRFRFREWLSTQIPIQWGKEVKGVQEDSNGVRLVFEDGTTAVGDIVVGADGINSIVREHLLQRPNRDVLINLPMSFIVGETTLSGTAFERMLSLGHSCYATSSEDGSYSIFVGLNQANPGGYSGQYYWYLMVEDHDVGKPDHWLQTATQAEKLSYAIKTTEPLACRFTEVIRSTLLSGVRNAPFILRELELGDLPKSRVTILGDAAHPMTPFRGEGGMQAIRDALNLSKILGRLSSNERRDIEASLAPYQQEMLDRGAKAVEASRNALKQNAKRDGKVVAWGQNAVTMPEENITLENCRS
ncbi:putative monooxygenase [Whalleya microplaca]|nr:putative monooxygenase [Whalleya microplaca]